MIDAVNQFVERHGLLHEGATVVTGVSGGPDSMVLLHYLIENQETWRLNIIVATVDHGLRGKASQDDLDYVEEFCRNRGIECLSAQVHTDELMKTTGLSTQVAARHLRYDFFKQVMRDYNADYLALGHHGDDQMETMLMRMVRGSFGLPQTGMPVIRPFSTGAVIRPLLCVDKDDILLYCQEHHIEPREDESNKKDTYTRNRFRKYVLPFLKQENPAAHTRFQQESEWMRDDFLYLHEQAGNLLETILLTKNAGQVVIDVEGFLSAPISLQRRMIHLILNYLYNSEKVDTYEQNQTFVQSVHIENLLRWLRTDKPSGEQHLPNGLVAEKSYNRLSFGHNREYDETAPFNVELCIPGTTETPVGLFQAKLRRANHSLPSGDNCFVCDWEQAAKPFYVRTRQPGDRIQPYGMMGTKKVKDIFIDKKVPKRKREGWPLIVDNRGRVLWIPALRHGHGPVVHPTTDQVLVLTFKPSEGH